jgi:hypothetical protein
MNLTWSALAAFLLAGQPAQNAKPKVDFAREVRPILANHCYACHGPDDKARKAKLRLDEFADATRERDQGVRAFHAGHPETSEAIKRIEDSEPTSVMPPPKFGKKPTAAEVEILKRWIREGAEYTRHWAYRPLARATPPAVNDPAWSVNPIDRFLLASMTSQNLKHGPRADRYALLRRVSLDLTGLPPTLEEADAFARDTRPDAYSRAVDAILAKPAYGERWASIWLDLARYGDSVGYTHDPPRSIWRWRDWLIQALNSNKPYDQFTIEMLAGDLLPGATTEQIIASGFHRNTTTNTEGGANSEEYHFAAVADRVNTTMQVWMGSTFLCAQCHSHKYDPFSHKEYYQIFAIFNSTADFNSEEPSLIVPRAGMETEFGARKKELDAAKAQLEAETKKADDQQASWEKALDAKKLPAEFAKALAVAADKRTKPQNDMIANHHRATVAEWVRAEALVKKLTPEFDRVSTSTMIMKEIPSRETFVALRGEFRSRGEKVQPGVPAELPVKAENTLNRLGFAKWLIHADNPLAPRVAANRLWQEIFGVGIVETSEEFGSQGNPPSHPELLDWLAGEYIRLGWDTKKLLKLIVTSEAYCQSSEASPEATAQDPDNRYLSRGPRIRLSAEAVRDQALAVSGLLSSRMYGPPAQPFQPANGLAAAFGQSTDWETGKGEESHRRAVYTRWRRNLPYPSMLNFDVPERAVCSVRRIRTNTPLQALVTLNDPVYFEAAQGLGRRIAASSGTTEEKIERGFRWVLIRPPSQEEKNRLVRLHADVHKRLAADPERAKTLATQPIGPLPAGANPAEAAAWTLVGNTLLNLDETLMKR